jgi:hypothetical protein
MAGRFKELIGHAVDGVAFEDVLTSLRQTFADHQQVPLGGQFASLDRVRDIDADTLVERRSGMACFVTRTEHHARIWFAGSRSRRRAPSSRPCGSSPSGRGSRRATCRTV